MTFDELLLTQLMEECSEVIKEVSKLLRFGPGDLYPGREKLETNNVRLANELHDLDALVEMIRHRLDIQLSFKAIDAKKAKVIHYMEYSQKIGILHEPIPEEFAELGAKYNSSGHKGNG